MNITVENAQGRVPVTILELHGDLDGSNYQEVIARARDLYGAGMRHLLIDMGDMAYMSSAGLVALHSVILLLRGEQPPDPESGWSAFHAIAREQGGVQKAVKLLNPQPRVRRTLEMTGMQEFFEIYADRLAAVESF
ncbi:MAG TPA: STAS domain-containing protein [Anaerolineae bacterium]|nr:STAS domain-containing protein [Anaerolineae bacterium]